MNENTDEPTPIYDSVERDLGKTIDVGYVHVLRFDGGPCIDNCPHPDHERDWDNPLT